MKNQKGISMITLIITIVVIIILAAIAIVASGDTINSAQFSTFASEFGDYAINFKTDPYAELEEKMGLQGVALTEAQKIYMAARNYYGPQDVTGVIVPIGVSFVHNFEDPDAETMNGLYNAAGQNVTEQYWGKSVEDADEEDDNPKAETIACYQIVDSQISGYKNEHKFYGDNLGLETHWVTQKGFVFTLPGYPREVDGEFRMYISPEVYYIAGENYSEVICSDYNTDVHDYEEVQPHKSEVVVDNDTRAIILSNSLGPIMNEY